MADHGSVRCAEIAGDGAIAMDLGGEAGAAPPKTTKGTLKGTVWFDVQLGAVRDAELVQDIMAQVKDAENPTELIAQMKNTTRTTLTKVVDLKK